MTKEDDKVPYWRVNVPKDEWPDTCPDFLLNTEDKGKMVLATKDEDYHILTWDEVETVVKDNDLDAFQRIPSDYRRYLEYSHKLKKEWGSIMNFVIQERIKWKDLTPSGQPFERAGETYPYLLPCQSADSTGTRGYQDTLQRLAVRCGPQHHPSSRVDQIRTR